jgi:hypothetical protein
MPTEHTHVVESVIFGGKAAAAAALTQLPLLQQQPYTNWPPLDVAVPCDWPGARRILVRIITAKQWIVWMIMRCLEAVMEHTDSIRYE